MPTESHPAEPIGESGPAGFEFEGESNEKEIPRRIEAIREITAEIAEPLIDLRRELHECPELGFQEHETSRRIVLELEKLGLEIESGVAGTGVIAILRGSEPGPMVALRADMDALPIQETGEAPFKSKKPGLMHACGHDAHVASVIGAAKILSRLKEGQGMRGDTVFLFQPNEEGTQDKLSGAVAMMRHLAKKGLWQEIDAIFGWHVSTAMLLETFNFQRGLFLAGCDQVDIKVTGPGGHAAVAHAVPNPLVAGSEINVKIAEEFGHPTPTDEARETTITPTTITPAKQ